MEVARNVLKDSGMQCLLSGEPLSRYSTEIRNICFSIEQEMAIILIRF